MVATRALEEPNASELSTTMTLGLGRHPAGEADDEPERE